MVLAALGRQAMTATPLLQTLRRGGPGLFVSGTDTGVGKTWVACRLAEWGRAQGWRMGVLKPAESGAGRGRPSP